MKYKTIIISLLLMSFVTDATAENSNLTLKPKLLNYFLNKRVNRKIQEIHTAERNIVEADKFTENILDLVAHGVISVKENTPQYRLATLGMKKIASQVNNIWKADESTLNFAQKLEKRALTIGKETIEKGKKLVSEKIENQMNNTQEADENSIQTLGKRVLTIVRNIYDINNSELDDLDESGRAIKTAISFVSLALKAAAIAPETEAEVELEALEEAVRLGELRAKVEEAVRLGELPAEVEEIGAPGLAERKKNITFVTVRGQTSVVEKKLNKPVQEITKKVEFKAIIKKGLNVASLMQDELTYVTFDPEHISTDVSDDLILDDLILDDLILYDLMRDIAYTDIDIAYTDIDIAEDVTTLLDRSDSIDLDISKAQVIRRVNKINQERRNQLKEQAENKAKPAVEIDETSRNWRIRQIEEINSIASNARIS